MWEQLPRKSLETIMPGDDVAHVSYGGKWRMPTKEEMEELIANCYNQFVGFVSITTVSVGYSVRGVLP